MREIIYTHAHLDIHIALYTIQESATFTLLFYYYVCVSVHDKLWILALSTMWELGIKPMLISLAASAKNHFTSPTFLFLKGT